MGGEAERPAEMMGLSNGCALRAPTHSSRQPPELADSTTRSDGALGAKIYIGVMGGAAPTARKPCIPAVAKLAAPTAWPTQRCRPRLT